MSMPSMKADRSVMVDRVLFAIQAFRCQPRRRPRCSHPLPPTESLPARRAVCRRPARSTVSSPEPPTIVSLPSAIQQIVAAVDIVVAVLAEDAIVAAAAIERVVAVPAGDRVGVRSGIGSTGSIAVNSSSGADL
jgi:hypothetical protein